MKTFATASALLAASVAAAANTGPFGPGTQYTNPKNPVIDYKIINANGGHFWVNKDASAYCPPNVQGLDCTAYSGTQTVLTGGNGTLSLNVAVPGGQQVYVDASGALSYTQAHSANVPEGSKTTGFSRKVSVAFGAPEYLSFNGNTWTACPTENNGTAYQVFATDAFSNAGEGCSTFAMILGDEAGAAPAVWEY